jgi:hypothetical protein
MKSITKFSPITEIQIDQLKSELKGVVSEEDLKNFNEFVKPYDDFDKSQLDTIFLIAELTIEGQGLIQSLNPSCIVNQENWWNYEDEPDIRIEDVNIPLKILTPQTPFEISGAKTFLVVLLAESNIWDLCKALPEWIWNEHKFEFMLSFTITTAEGNTFYGNVSDEYANKLIEF